MTTEMTHLRVLIAGGGVAGTALAFWLAKVGYEVTIVERFPELRVNGLQIDLRGHAIELTKLMGINPAVQAKCVKELGIEVVDTHGKRWAFLPSNTSGKGAQSFTSEYEIMRGDLCQILYDQEKDNVKYKFGTSISSYEDRQDGRPIAVEFADGTTAEYDLVVGADGLFSRTRKMMLEDGQADPMYSLHQYIAYLRIPSEAKAGEGNIARAYCAPGNKFVLTRRHSPHEMQVYFISSNKKLTQRLDHIKRGDVDAEKQVYSEEYRGIGWIVDDLLEKLRTSNDFYCQLEAFVRPDSWSRGRVTLLGDAAFSASANGFGTSCALIGAYILAGELLRSVGDGKAATQATKEESIKKALEAYENKLRPLVEQEQKGLGEKSFFDDLQLSGWQIRVIYWIMWAVTVFRVYRIAEFLPDRGTKNWHLPNYPELNDLCKPKQDGGKREL